MEAKVQRQMLAALANAMGLEGITPDTVVGTVERLGDKIIVPKDANLDEVIQNLVQQRDREAEMISLSSDYPVPPWDGARAVNKAIVEVLGIALTAYGNEIEIETSLGVVERVTWGTYKLPGMGPRAHIDCGVNFDDKGRMTFRTSVHCQRRFEERVQKLLERIREICATESLHKGKAFTMQFLNDDGEHIALPIPKFFPLSDDVPIFRRDLEDSIDRNIYTVLKHPEQVTQMGESLKRGVLLAGTYGTGKTMQAQAIARVATDNGWTFVYVKDPRELQLALQFAQRYQPCVVYGEDVDRVGGTQRSDSVNDLLNELDGIDSKSAKIFTVLTTNHPERINSAMRRPGRIDLVLQVLPPDAEAATRMMLRFAKGQIADGTDLQAAANVLDNLSPAFIAETVKRAKLEALRRTGKAKSLLNGEDLLKAANEVVAEHQFFNRVGHHAGDGVTSNNLATAFDAASAALKKASKKEPERA